MQPVVHQADAILIGLIAQDYCWMMMMSDAQCMLQAMCNAGSGNRTVVRVGSPIKL